VQDVLARGERETQNIIIAFRSANATFGCAIRSGWHTRPISARRPNRAATAPEAPRQPRKPVVGHAKPRPCPLFSSAKCANSPHSSRKGLASRPCSPLNLPKFARCSDFSASGRGHISNQELPCDSFERPAEFPIRLQASFGPAAVACPTPARRSATGHVSGCDARYGCVWRAAAEPRQEASVVPPVARCPG
jgi:hypothetical protein